MKEEMERHFRKEVARIRKMIREGEGQPEKLIQSSIFLTEEEKKMLLKEFQEEQLREDSIKKLDRKVEILLQEIKKSNRRGTYLALFSIALTLYLEFRGEIDIPIPKDLDTLKSCIQEIIQKII